MSLNNTATTLFAEPYQGYAYSYPHKQAYRKFDKPVDLQKLWDGENKKNLFTYFHIPFCEMRCGFCNLFTVANPKEQVIDNYLKALREEAKIMKSILRDASFTQAAVGGGTPTFLDVHQLEYLFDIIENVLGISLKHISNTFEMSPKTITKEKLNFLKSKGVERVSMGIQSFLDVETKQLGRPQQVNEVYKAIDLIKSTNFPIFNLDLIYGGSGQTIDSWLYSLNEAMKFKPEEIFLYPLYVRPLTGLEKMVQSWDNLRLSLYRAGRDFLLEKGYEQLSMRSFRKIALKSPKLISEYSCQEDGMVGLGAGARSYTKSMHYSSEYAVERKGVKQIISEYIAKPLEEFYKVDYGIVLSFEEQKRRFLIKSLLHGDGISSEKYFNLYQSLIFDDFPELNQLLDEQYIETTLYGFKLTSIGLEYSDAIGPWLYSGDIKRLIQSYSQK